MGLLSNLMMQSIPSFDSLRKNVNDMIAETNAMLADITFDDVETQIKQARTRLNREVKRLTRFIKNLTDRYVVEVPYNRDTQKLSHSLKDGILSVTTHDLDGTRTNTTEVELPDDVFIESLTQKYSTAEKKMVFTFQKNGQVSTAEEGVEDDGFDDVDAINNTVASDVDSTEEPVETNETNETPTNTFDTIGYALTLHDNGWSYRKIAQEIGVSDKTIARWVKKYRTLD